MEKIEKLIAEIETLTVIELADLVKAIEEKFGVSAAAAVVAVAGGAAAGAPAAEAVCRGRPTGQNLLRRGFPYAELLPVGRLVPG